MLGTILITNMNSSKCLLHIKKSKLFNVRWSEGGLRQYYKAEETARILDSVSSAFLACPAASSKTNCLPEEGSSTKEKIIN